MNLRKFFALVFLINAFAFHAYADQDLSPGQLSRLKAAKGLIGDADSRSLQEAADELRTSPDTEGALQILEAVAAVYVELVRDYALDDSTARVRLLDKIRMNMAYFQMGGPDSEGPQESDLNILIRRKLKEHLSSELRNNPKLFYSLE
ncbi:MAG TPA: hypothetical protein PL155_02980 [Candidatus Omnitrophota bacterium]|nr:hypothetical protein [Candidatus Omnitrophota bacterium]HPD84554.1 hypothetical protein [Candidatus Omnitrophota bacterium]HRZ03412.1 hypothetical protein [Candidatus Omnitrophota bacterium]